MAKMKEEVRVLVGLENLLQKARRRHRECEREYGAGKGSRAAQYADLVRRLKSEIETADHALLEDYLAYVEETFLPRLSRKVESTKEEMVAAAKKIVDGKAHLHELRSVYTDALDRIRSVRERLELDPFRPLATHFGLGAPPPNADRHVREAHDLVKEYLKS